jgi:hypothetical protein
MSYRSAEDMSMAPGRLHGESTGEKSMVMLYGVWLGGNGMAV